VVEAGRYRDYVEDAGPDTRQFWYEVEHCQHEIRRGPGQAMRWGVWESPAYDGLIARGHDDLLVSAALVVVLDKQQWPATGESGVVEPEDVLDDIDAGDLATRPPTAAAWRSATRASARGLLGAGEGWKLTSPQRLGTLNRPGEETRPADESRPITH
jgi:hypothetical protein